MLLLVFKCSVSIIIYGEKLNYNLLEKTVNKIYMKCLKFIELIDT